MSAGSQPEERSLIAAVGLWLGPALALTVWLSQPVAERLGGDWSLPFDARMAGVVLWMAVWWVTEAVPMAVTALLPLAAYPLLRIMPGGEVAQFYAHKDIFLFLGGFLIALAMEESGLHRRIALRIVAAVGDSPRQVVLGFMLATAVLSMWISNTATTMMMLPIAMSVVEQADAGRDAAPESRRFGVCLMLGLAYSASIGGLATLVGTPTNVVFVGQYLEFTGTSIAVFDWMKIGLPLSAVLLAVAWLLLVRVLFRLQSGSALGGRDVIRQRLAELGPMRRQEWLVGAVFVATALLWIFREPVDGWGWAVGLGVENYVDDGTVAIAMAILCFLIPRDGGRPLLSWTATRRMPWGILLLFGGGFVLAGGMKVTGLDRFLGDQLATAIGGTGDLGRSLLIAFGMTWLTEITSNTASANMLLPILAGTAESLKVTHLDLMLPATLAASCAFALPVATPPNAIVYGSGRLRVVDMFWAGLWLNLIGVVLVTAAVLLLGNWALG